MYQSHKSINSVHGKRQILIVDDEEINRELLSEMLSEEFEILTAENGKKALDVIRRNSAFLSAVLLDVLMPEMNGF